MPTFSPRLLIVAASVAVVAVAAFTVSRFTDRSDDDDRTEITDSGLTANGGSYRNPRPDVPGGSGGRDASTDERADMGVAPPRGLYNGPFHAPTPNTIPGGQVITTRGLVGLLTSQKVKVHLFDVLGGPQAMPTATSIPWAAAPGSFDDATQQQMAALLRQTTGGADDAVLVFYCQSAHCWMSYNAAARAIALGYKNVLWYRGGIEAWARGGNSVVASSQPAGGQPGYGGGQPGYGGGQPGYGGGQPGYGGGQPGYGGGQPGYGGGQPGYGGGQPGYGGGQPGYGGGQPGYGQPGS